MARFRECDSYTESQRYTCLDPDLECCAPEGGLHACCEIGCCPCSDSNLLAMRASPWGRRWMKPAPGETNRNALGEQSNLVSNEPLRVPHHVNFLRAPCYAHPAREFFGADVCDCHPPPNPAPDPDTERCEDGEEVGEILRGTFPDCFFWREDNWISSGDWLFCRTVENHGDVLVRLLPASPDIIPFTSHLVRGDHGGDPLSVGGTPPCTANAFVLCTENQPISPCRLGGGPHVFYNAGPCRQIWNFVEIDLGAEAPERRPQVAGDSFFPDPGVLDLRNAVLDAVATETFPGDPDADPPIQDVNFEQLDDVQGRLSAWGRSYLTGDIPCALMLAVADLPGSYQVYTHDPIVAELVVTAVTIKLHLVPYRMDMAEPGAADAIFETHPYARLWIRAECRIRLTLPDGSCRLAPNAQLGPIVYVDSQDRVIAEPPRVVDWWAMLGAFSDPVTENIEFHENDGCFGAGTTDGICRTLASDLSGLIIPAWPAMAGSFPSDPNKLYTGEVRLNFEHSGFDACCPG